MNNKELIIETLTKSELPLKAGEIAHISGIDKKEVDKLIKTLKSEDLIISPKRCYYTNNK